jgi:non-specific protein-tyrosine kinase
MDIMKYLKVGLRWWWLILFSVALSATASYIYSQRLPKIYAARTSLLVGSSIIESLNPEEGLLKLSVTLAEVYAQMAYREPVAQAVIDKLGLNMSPGELAGMIQTNVIPNAQLLEIFVLDVHPQRARILADAVAEELIFQSPAASQRRDEREKFIEAQLANLQVKIEDTDQRIAQLNEEINSMTSAVEISEAQSQVGELEQLKADYQASYNQFLSNLSESSPNRLTVFEPATQPFTPVSPNIKMNVVIAAGAGFVLALTAIILLEFFDDTLIWRRDDLQTIFGVPVLGAVSRMADGDHKLVSYSGQNEWSIEADALRNLRSSISLAAGDHPIATLLVTSASPGEGKSHVASNLAATMASSMSGVSGIIAAPRTSVILIDADLRKPSLHEAFELPNLLGLADVLAMPDNAIEVMLKKALRPTTVDNLLLLPAGRTPLDPGSLLTSPRFAKAIQLLGAQADIVIIDSPPILQTVETKAIVNIVDSTLLVVSSGQTGRKTIRRVLDYFATLRDNNLLGIVFNRAKISGDYSYYSLHTPRTGLEQRHEPSSQPSLLGSLLPFGRSQQRETSVLSLAEVAVHLGVSETTAERWCEQGRLAAIKKGRRWTVRLEDLNQFISVYQLDSFENDPDVPVSLPGTNGDTRAPKDH